MTIEAALKQPSPVSTSAFTAVMARLVSDIAVVTARKADGQPYGLLVSSLCSFSVNPPSVLVAIDSATRSYPVLCAASGFGVHLLSAAQTNLAEVFAGHGQHKFDATDWGWDGSVPQLRDVAQYLRCVTTAVFPHGDHAVLIGAVEHCESRDAAAEPLVYYRKRMGWRLVSGAS